MGRGRGRGRTLACLLAGLALIAAGCGTEEHENDPRPPVPTRVSVSITEDELTVAPSSIGSETERDRIPQNTGIAHRDIRSDAPLIVTFVAANLTPRATRLAIHGLGKNATSDPVVADGNGTFQVALPTGDYLVRATSLPRARPARVHVGAVRPASSNDVLLP